jgi:hypothetical protein
MRKRWQNWLFGPIVAAMIPMLTLVAEPGGHAGALRQAASQAIVACRVLEVHTSAQPAVTMIVFHQQDQKDGTRLGSLLRQHSDASVQFQTADGTWHSATVARLKSCFGRGLLLFPSGGAPLAQGGKFLLKFPSN